MEQYVLELVPPPEPTFGSFIAGANTAAVRALEAFAAGALRDEVLYLWGPHSTGRTHLLRASIAVARARGQSAALIDARTLTSTGTAPATDSPPVAAEPTPESLTRHPSHPVALLADCDLWAIDNVHLIAREDEQTLFNLFVSQRAHGGRLLFAADRPPVDTGTRDDVRTRLASGLVFEIAPLTDDEKLAALRAKANAMAVPVSEAILDWLIAHADRHLGTLTAVLASLDRYSLSTQRPITLPLARTVLRQLQQSTVNP